MELKQTLGCELTELQFIDKGEENSPPWLARFHAGLCFRSPLFS